MVEYKVPLGLIVVILSGIIYIRNYIISYTTATAQIPQLVATTLDRLATQAALAADGRVDDSFISVGQLRDDVLRATFSKTERERVWKGVKNIVESNSNIRAATREASRTGETSRVWEWIGPVNLVPGLEGRSSGGLIQDRSSPATEQNGSSGKEMVEKRKWHEGRPIY